MVGFINANQTKEERNNKYRFLRDCGLNSKESQRLRSWSHNHIILYLYNKNIRTKTTINNNGMLDKLNDTINIMVKNN